MIEVSIIIPAYNEEKRLGAILSKLEKLPKYYEVIVAADGSTDETFNIAKAFNVRVVGSSKRLGKGGGILNAFKHCQGKTIVTLDVDYPYPLTVETFVAELQQFDADILLGRRQYFIKPPVQRQLASRLFRLLVSILFGRMPDTQSGFKAIRRCVLADLSRDLYNKSFLWDLELCLKAKRKGYKIVETFIPDNYSEASKVNVLKDGLFMAFAAMQLWMKLKKACDSDL